MFFSIGFALGINSYLIPLLNQALDISSSESYLVLAATFSAFIVFGYPASLVISKIGYKKTMALSFLMFSLGFFLYLPSARMESLTLFLIASFISGMGNTFLQATVNPYVTILGPIESAAKRISIMGIANKLAWPVAPMFLALVIGKSVNEVSLADIQLPFIIIIAVFLLLGLLALLSPLPEVKAAGEDESSADECPYAVGKTSIWQFPHLLLGVLALFLYVGAETISLGTLVDYAESLGMPNPEYYAWIAPVGMVTGYLAGIVFIPKYISQSKALLIVSVIAVVGSLSVVLMPQGAVYLLCGINGIRMFTNVACNMAFGYDRFGSLHKNRLIAYGNCHCRWCIDSSIIWSSKGRLRCSECILDCCSHLLLYTLLCPQRPQDQGVIVDLPFFRQLNIRQAPDSFSDMYH